MKLNIETYLHKIDENFTDKPQKDIYMTYIIIFASIFAFAYLLFWDTSENEYKQINIQIDSIKLKINNDNSYLQFNPESKITILDKEIKDAKAELILYKDDNEYIKHQIETIAYLVYDERTWGEYLHSISKNAREYNIKIKDFTNKYVLNNKSFGHILNINIQSTGEYKNTLNFINSLEQSDLVVDIHTLALESNGTLKSDLNISVWGIIY